MRPLNSLAFKNAVFYLVLFLIGLSMMGFLLLESSSKRIIKNAEDQLLHSSNLIEILIQEYIEELVTDLQFLSGNPVLLKYLDYNTNDNYSLLNEEFLSLISSNSDYSQIRYLDAYSGKELVRVDRMNGNPKIIPFDQLQVKKNRLYFSRTIELDSNSIYFSPIDLNKEYGSISKPYTPTFRIARSIYFNDTIHGIVVINTDLTKLFNKLQKSVKSNFSLRIFNDEGYYLLHEEKDSSFIFEFGNYAPQVTVNPDNFPYEIVNTQNELISVHKVSLPQKEYNMHYHIIANKMVLLAPYYIWMRHSIYRILFIAIFFTGIAFFIFRSQFKNLQKLKTSIQMYPIRREISKLPINRKDEIGELAKSFEEMVAIINSQIKSIESEKQKAEQAEKDKSNFIENITHEIRNPLQSIIGLSTILEQNNPNPNQIDILKSIRLNTTNLNALINSILDYQNILKGNLKLQKEYTDVSNLIQDLVTGIRFTADKKNIKIGISINAELKSVKVNIDRLRTTQILNNLILNAISHTQTHGEIVIAVNLSASADNHYALKYSVSDNGVGMTASEIEQIKERYYTKSKESILNPNFGLGLTIVNELLNLMGSELKIKSEKKVGSTFSFEIIADIRNNSKRNISTQNQASIIENKKVLIIEDDEQVMNLYQYYFEKSDATFLSSFDSLAQIPKVFYDFVITDFYVKGESLNNFIPSFQNIISKSTSMIVISGKQLKLESIERFFPNVVIVQKPISKTSLFQSIQRGSTFSRFGKPRIKSIQNDYDNDPSKYNRAFELLLKEWKVYTNRLSEKIKNGNTEGLEQVIHKLNNTLKRLELFKFEEYLSLIKESMSDDNFDFNSKSNEISEVMQIYYDFLYERISYT